jgi:AraC-like DNA-binding protein
MSVHFHHTNGREIKFSPGYIPHFRVSALAHSDASSFISDSLQFVVQEISNPDFTFRHQVIRLSEPFSFKTVFTLRGLFTRIVLKGQSSDEVAGLPATATGEAEYSSWFGTIGEVVTHVTGAIYESIDILCAGELLRKFSEVFPALDSFPDNESNSSCGLFNQRRPVTIPIIDVIQQIFRYRFDPQQMKYFIDYKVSELLFLTLAGHDVEKEKFVSESDSNAIAVARSVIENNINEHHSIADLSRMVSLNEFKFKTLFRQIVGVGPFEYLLSLRLNQARILILETDKPIKEIAGLCGYASVANFITAFRKRFGITPRGLRKDTYER